MGFFFIILFALISVPLLIPFGLSLLYFLMGVRGLLSRSTMASHVTSRVALITIVLSLGGILGSIYLWKILLRYILGWDF